jgi:hypothetical protein
MVYDSSKVYTATIQLEVEDGDDWKEVWDSTRAEILANLEKRRTLTDEQVAIVASWYGEENCDTVYDAAEHKVAVRTKGNFKVHKEDGNWTLDQS